MVVEGVSSSPPDQPHIGVSIFAAVIVEPTARVLKHIRDARDGNEILHRVLALRQGSIVDLVPVETIVIRGPK